MSIKLDWKTATWNDLIRAVRDESAPTAIWNCRTCGWKGLDLTIGQAGEYHQRWNSKQGKHCPGAIIKEE